MQNGRGEVNQHEMEEAQNDGNKIVRWRVFQRGDIPTPLGRYGHRAVAVQNNIVVMGGGNENMMRDIHVFNTYLKRWLVPRVRGKIPPIAAAFGACAVGTKIYIFGGYLQYGEYGNQVHILDTTRWRWSRLKTTTKNYEPRPRVGCSFVASEKTQKAYLFGGLCNALDSNTMNFPLYMNDFYVLALPTSPDVFVWKKIQTQGDSPIPRESHTAVLYETDRVSRMIVYGGMNGARLGDLWYMDLNTFTWTEIKLHDPLVTGITPIRRSLHTSVLIEDKMFVFGGNVPQNPMEDDYVTHKWRATKTLCCWDITQNRWIPLRQSAFKEGGPGQRSGHCAATSGGRMYIWSGKEHYSQPLHATNSCRDMWYLETMKPEQPKKVVLEGASSNMLEIKIPHVKEVDRYLLQVSIGDPKDVVNGDQESSLEQFVMPFPKIEVDEMPISTKGTTYTAAATKKSTTEGAALPQDLLEDTDNKESIGSSAAGVNLEDQKGVHVVPWFDIGVIKKGSIKVTDYFNGNQQPLQEQVISLIANNKSKCVNDPIYTPGDKIPLINGQAYCFRVASVNSFGLSPWSEPVTFKTDIELPGGPSRVRITNLDDGIHLNWNPPDNIKFCSPIKEYTVHLAIRSPLVHESGNQVGFMQVYSGAEPQCVIPAYVMVYAEIDRTQTPGIVFRVWAKNDKGNGLVSQFRWLRGVMQPPVNYYPNGNPRNYILRGPRQE